MVNLKHAGAPWPMIESHCLLRGLAFKSRGILIAVNRLLLNACGAWESKLCGCYLSSLGYTVSRNKAYLPSLLLLQIANDILVWDALRSFVSWYQPEACSVYTLAALIMRNNKQHVSLRFVIFSHSAPASASAGHSLGPALLQQWRRRDSRAAFVLRSQL